ncbi:MAG: PAS domain S-box protein [Anaerolineaceae bacterium]|nr:MAG: PAS domain S-box protein [Anaerolineaceae bacterium]
MMGIMKNMLMLSPIDDYRVRQRDFLLQISRAITAKLDLNEVLRLALHASLIMLKGQVGLVALRAQDDVFYVKMVSGVERDKVPSLNDHLHRLNEIVRDGGGDDAVNDQLNLLAQAIDPGLIQTFALPLMFAEEPLGMMIVCRDHATDTTVNDRQVLQSFADQAAIAVHNAQLYERINQERQRLAAILQHSADGVMILNPDLVIVRFNRALERITGWEAVDAIGQYQADVLQLHNLADGDLADAIADGWPFTLAASNYAEAPLYVEGDLLRADGMAVSIGITYAPMFNPDGTLNNIIANVRDISHFRQAQDLQNTFISVVSHELKTPVAIIKGYAATLNRPDAQWDGAVVRETLDVIEDEADRLNDLIQNLLTASKLQTQREMVLEMGEVDLPRLIAQSVERSRKQTAAHRIITDISPDFPVIEGDSTRLRQVIDNLISNAIKYSPEGGQIEVSGDYDVESVTVCVRDHGVGLAHEDQKRVFDRFFRVDGKLTRTTQGTGLGLYLVKAIIEAHGGAVAVESKIGQGSTFYFTIPR